MKRVIMAAAVGLLGAALAYGQSAGGGISFFVPESLLEGSGSVSKEAGLSTSLGFGDVLSLPAGFTYIKASGFLPYNKTDGELKRMDNRIWYTADTFIPYLRLKGTVDIGPLYLEGFGGVAGAWIVAPQAFEAQIGKYYAPAGDLYYFTKLESDFSLGYGYQAGATAGVRVDAVSVGLEVIFTDLRAKTTVSSDDYVHYKENDSADTGQSGFEKSFTSRLRGLSLGITGSFAF